MRIVVIGAGVSGLTCAVRLLDEGARAVTIVAREQPARTTSAVAGAVWFPYRVRPNRRTGPWAAAGYERFEQFARDDRLPVTMVDLTILYGARLAEEPWWLGALPDRAVRPTAELPDAYADGRSASVPCIEAPAYLDWLARRFTELGGRVEQGELAALGDAGGGSAGGPDSGAGGGPAGDADRPAGEALRRADVVINCAGSGAQRLAGDPGLRPVRGQVAYVRTREPVRFLVDEDGPNALAYVLPRPDVTVLGGTAEEDDWDMNPREATTRSILERTRRLDPRLEHATYVGSAVGLRPARAEVRLERDALPDGRRLIHNYGHGGSGFTLSWGCAEEVARLALDSAA